MEQFYSTPQERMEAQRLLAQHAYNRKVGVAPEAKLKVGPWVLGKILGEGSSALVRMCKHDTTRKAAAVKVVAKRTALLAQAGSIAALHHKEAKTPYSPNGEPRMPMSIEREVALLKLVDHPHIIKLFDVWESRDEM